MIIKGGYTLWARQIYDSEIFYSKPDKWFKIWFYIVSKVNHKDNKLFKRGENLITYGEISARTKATKTQIYKLIKWAKKERMIDAEKTTRGFIIKVLNYSIFQDSQNYTDDKKTTRRRQEDDTINNNNKNIIITTTVGQDAGKSYLDKWNQVFTKAYTSTKAIEGNLKKWLESYSLEEILSAIEGIKRDSYWKDKDLSPEWLLRTKEKGEPVDRIGRMLNNKVKSLIQKI